MKKKEGGLMRQRKYELENGVAGTMRPVVRKIRFFTLIKLLMRRSCKKNGFIPAASIHSLPNLASPFFIQLLNCFNVQLFKCFPAPSSFRVSCSRFLLRREKTKVFTLIELLMRECCKSGISVRQQGWAGRCQSPDPASSFFLPLLNCSIVRLFQCFSTSSFPVLCSRFLLRRVKIDRAPHRDCNHRDSRGNAAAGAEQGKGSGKYRKMPQ